MKAEKKMKINKKKPTSIRACENAFSSIMDRVEAFKPPSVISVLQLVG
jgi:hypothetical protein